jgi:hypothetical protein
MLAFISYSTMSRYYGRHGHPNPVIRVSDHDRINDLSDSRRLTVRCCIDENMTEDDAWHAAEKAIQQLTRMEHYV